MKIYEKPLAIINKFEVEDVIAVSGVTAIEGTKIDGDYAGGITITPNRGNARVLFTWGE